MLILFGESFPQAATAGCFLRKLDKEACLLLLDVK